MSSRPPAIDNVKVLLFSGHMIDRAGRVEPRFPPNKVRAAARALEDLLRGLRPEASTLAICSGACGGDILFAEAAARLGCRIWLYLPFERNAFIKTSVEVVPGDWGHRFKAIEEIAQHEFIGEASPDDRSAFAANNARMLESALSLGGSAGGVHLVCLWDGLAGDGPGGTADMVEGAVRSGAGISRIDPRGLN